MRDKLYILLTNLVFSVRTISYGPSFFPFNSIYGPSTKRVGHKWGSITYSTDREDEVSKIFIISLLCVWWVRERFPFIRNGFKFLNQVKSKMSQFDIVFESSARFSTQFVICFTRWEYRVTVINHPTVWQQKNLKFSQSVQETRAKQIIQQ